MRAGLKLAAARGVTAVHDKDGWLGALRLWQRLERAGRADAARLAVGAGRPGRRARALGIASGLGSPLLRLGYLKAFMDGTLGSQTALMLDGSGVRITSGEELAEIVLAGAAAGLPGRGARDRRRREPRGARRVRARRATIWEPLGLRHRIEHAQLLAPEDLPRFAALGVACSVQFSHAPSDRDLADRFWAGKTDGAYAYRSLVDSGAVVANGSDAPIEELDPLAGIRAGVRRTIDAREAWHPEQAVTVQQAFEATTLAPGLAQRRRAPARPPDPRLRRRPRRARPRPVGRPRRRGRRDDGRRALGAQPAALGLTPLQRRRTRAERARARRRSRAARTPRAAARSGEWMFESGSPKPVMIVGIPLSARAGTIGSVPPVRISAGRTPSTRSKASSPSWIAFASGGTSPGGDDDQRSISSVAPSGAASRRSRSTSGAISSTCWPGASRIERFATASTGSTVFCRCGEPLSIPFTSSAGSANVRR